MTKRNPEKFWNMIHAHFFRNESSELEYVDFLEIGETCGLLREVPYDPKKHGDELIGDPEPGDMIYVPTKKARKS